jgi:HK97 family phage major capsid protein
MIKSFDGKPEAAPGQSKPAVPTTRPGATRKSLKPASVRLNEMKTFGEQITALEATRAAMSARLAEIMQKAIDEGRSTDEQERDEYDELDREVDALDEDLKRLRKLEKNNAQAAQPIGAKTMADGTEARANGGNGYIRVVPPQLDKGIRFARVAKCVGMAKGNLGDALAIAGQRYSDDQGIQNVLKAALAAGTTDPDSWTGALVGEETGVFADFLEYLRPLTIVGKFGTGNIPNLCRVPFRTALISQTSGGAAWWVVEGQAKPLTSFDFARTSLLPLKASNIAVVTDELLRDSSPSAETLLRDSLAAALQERLDIDFIDPAKTAVPGVSPASITNGAPTTGSVGNDADSIRADIASCGVPEDWITAADLRT